MRTMWVMLRPATNRSNAPLLLCAVLAFSACSVPQDQSAHVAPAKSGFRALSRVDRMVQREHARPIRRIDAPFPPLIDPTQLKAITDLDTRAGTPLEQLAPLFPLPSTEPPTTTAQADTSRRSPALRAYLKGLHAIRAGQYDEAVDRLRTASSLSPTEAEPWLALGEAYSLLGNRIAASGAYRRAIEVDPLNHAALDILSRQAIALKDYDRALPYLFALLAQDSPALDQAIPYLVYDRLGKALQSEGYARAAVQAFERAIDLPERVPATRTHALDIGELYRERGARALLIGDALVRLDEPEAASEWYARAAHAEGVDQTRTLARQLYIQLVLGRPASAIKTLTEAILSERVRVDGETSKLIEYLSGEIPDRGLLAETLTDATALLEPGRADRLWPSLLRASAVALGPEGATEYLLGQLRTNARNTEAQRLLFELIAGAPVEQRASTLAELVRLAPEAGKQTVRQASWLWGDLDVIAEAVREAGQTLPPDQADAMILCQGLLLSADGRPADAADAWESASTATESGQLARAFLAQELVRLDRWDDSTAALESLATATSPWSQTQTAIGWSLLERTDEALAAVQRAEALAQSIPLALSGALMTRSRILSQSGAPADIVYELAERAFQIAPDSFLAVGYLYTLSYRMHLEEGAGRRDELLRSVGSLPDGSALATLARAQLLLRSNRANVAYRVLREFANTGPPNQTIDQLYFAIIKANRLFEEGLPWLRKRAAQVPSEQLYTLWRAELLLGLGESEADRSRRLLESWLDRYPGDDRALIRLSDIYRDHLKDIARADERIIGMLVRRPQTTERKLLAFQIHQRQGDIPEMTRILEALEPAFDRLTKAQVQSLRAVAGRLTDSGAAPRFEPAHVYEFMRTLLRVDRELPVNFRVYVATLAFQTGEPAESVIELFDDPAITHEQREQGLTQLAHSLIREQGVGQEHVRFYETLIERDDANTMTRNVQWLAVMFLSSTALTSSDEEELLASSIRRALANLDKAGRYTRGIEEMAEFIESDNRSGVTPAICAHGLAIVLDRIGAPEAEVDRLYRTTLEFDPDHANANNNLGYRMLERGDDTRQAFEYIKRAYRVEPSSPHIMDSYGWALHKLGFDRTQEDGSPGAIEILTQTVEAVQKQIQRFKESAHRAQKRQDKAQENVNHEAAFFSEVTLVTVYAHLGDASWSGNDREKAVRYWNLSATKADSFSLLDFPFEVAPATREQYEAAARSSHAKVRAASEDRDPLAVQIPGD